MQRGNFGGGARFDDGSGRRMHQPLNTCDIPADDPWAAAMRRGDFEAAWRVSDAVLQQRRAAGVVCWRWPRHLQFIWTGEPLAGRRVLVRCYHGLGDTIQFIRFAAPLRRLAREVTVWVQPALLALVATAPGVDRVLPLHDGVPDVDYDVDVEIMELAHVLRVTPDLVGAHVPYLSRPPAPSPLPRADSMLSVGLVWQAGDWDRRRSLSADLVRTLVSCPGTRFYSLQVGAARREAAALGLCDVADDDIATTAARMRRLDLVISVDTMAAHLAGALGVPVWTLLHAGCDWRWMAGRSDSLWYPSMRLFRQRSAGDWRGVMSEIRFALSQAVQQHNAARRR